MEATASGAADLALQLARAFRPLVLRDVPSAVQDSARLALCNIVGVAIGGARTDTAAAGIRWARALGGPPHARAIGCDLVGPVDRVAVIDGITAHVLDFDDTHLETVLHPSAPAIAGLLPLAEWRGLGGERFFTAWITGLEVGCRTADALGREHYDVGWHVTSTAGVLGAAAACAMALGLDEERFANALRVAATLACGHREQFGSMTKSLHAGMAGMHGLTAALLAESGYDGARGAIDGKRGLLNVMSTAPNAELLLRGFGRQWDLLANEIKPYACGVVTHPAIDGARALKQEHGLRPDDIASILLRVHPLVAELTNKPDPRTGLEAKFSVVHCVAVGLMAGRAGPDEFTDEAATAAPVVEVRRKVRVVVDQKLAHLTAVVEATIGDGRVVRVNVDRARGTHERPLTRDEVEAKFVQLTERYIAADPRRLFERLRRVDEETSVADLVAATAPVVPASPRPSLTPV